LENQRFEALVKRGWRGATIQLGAQFQHIRHQQLKRDELVRYKSPVEVRMMRAVKRALDPLGLMNPGKVL